MKPRTLLAWSSGKDSAWSLHVLRQRGKVDVVGLLTTINEVHDRVAMHAVRRDLLEAQAAAAGLPLWPVLIPSPSSNEQYETAMGVAVARARDEGITRDAFRDLFLEDIRAYRQRQLACTGLHPLSPLWQIPTPDLARRMLSGGLRARLTCVDPKRLSKTFAGRTWDESLIAELPVDVDPCGENGEFHTFVSAGPMFTAPLEVRVGQVVERDGFVFADVLAPPSSARSERTHLRNAGTRQPPG